MKNSVLIVFSITMEKKEKKDCEEEKVSFHHEKGFVFEKFFFKIGLILQNGHLRVAGSEKTLQDENIHKVMANVDLDLTCYEDLGKV